MQSRQYFYSDYSGASLNPITLWTQPSLRRLITIHPIKKPDNMLSLHHFYKSLEFEEDYERLHKTTDYLNALCRELPPGMAPPLSVSASCNLKLHPHLTYFNASSKLSPRVPSASPYLVHRDKVPFYLRPTDKFDLQSWTRFNDSLVQQVGGVTPSFSPHGSLLAEVRHALSMLRPYISLQHTPQQVEIKHLLDGYVRFNPHLGREYIFHLSLSLKDGGPRRYRRYHMVREIGPQVAVVDLPTIPSQLQVNVILPLTDVGESFVEFLTSLGHVGLQYPENAIRLVVVVFKDSHASLAEKTLAGFTHDTFPVSATISLHHASGVAKFDALRGFDLGVASLKEDDMLAFLADVGVRFAPGFFRRCRGNAVLGQKVYLPVPFKLYQSDFREFSDGSVPPIAAWTGQWAHYQLRNLCVFKRDYDNVDGYRTKRYSAELVEALAANSLDVMQAPEPGLFKVWGGSGCRGLSSVKRRSICADMRRGGQYDQTELADYLAEFAGKKDDFIKFKDNLW